jgi:hypothetical protein
MDKSKKILLFFFTPLLIIFLLYANAMIISNQLRGNTGDWSQYKAELSSDASSMSLGLGQSVKLEVAVKNKGTMTWISSGEHPIFLAYRIKESSGKRFLLEGDRIAFSEALKPGESANLLIELVAPSGAGNYLIVIDVVHEGITWFEEKGSEPLVIELEVQSN